MKCKDCQKTKKQCSLLTLSDENIICKKCKLCKCCRKNNTISFCKICSGKCKKCKKIVHKYNWPDESFINNKCNKCNNLCKICDKYTVKHINYKNKRYCIKCFEYKYNPSTNMIKYKSKITKNNFIEWTTFTVAFRCKTCNRKKWHFNKNKTICNTCLKNNSTIKTKNIIELKTIICISCYNLFTTNDVINNKFRQCINCKPIKKNTKFSYDNDLQKWVITGKKINCSYCNKIKWTYKKYNWFCLSCYNSNKVIKKPNFINL